MHSPINLLTIKEYLQLEQTSETRHEYLGGQVFAMSGGSKEHNIISLNIASSLRSHLRGSSCRAFMADMKVKIESTRKNKSVFYYPDVVVSCNPDEEDRFCLNYPCLIIEVLSPSTEATDRREKLVNYQDLASLQEYVLVSQEEIRVEVYRKDSEGSWSRTVLEKDDELWLNSVGLSLAMGDIYEDVF